MDAEANYTHANTIVSDRSFFALLANSSSSAFEEQEKETGQTICLSTYHPSGEGTPIFARNAAVERHSHTHWSRLLGLVTAPESDKNSAD